MRRWHVYGRHRERELQGQVRQIRRRGDLSVRLVVLRSAVQRLLPRPRDGLSGDALIAQRAEQVDARRAEQVDARRAERVDARRRLVLSKSAELIYRLSGLARQKGSALQTQIISVLTKKAAALESHQGGRFAVCGNETIGQFMTGFRGL